MNFSFAHHQVAHKLREMIASGQWPSGSKLPSTRQLAGAFGIAVGTLRKALLELEKNGFIERKARSGIYVCGQDSIPPGLPDVSSLARPEQIANSIMDDISQGYFRIGDFLPSQKELGYRYNTSPITLSKALRMAMQSKLVHRQGASFVAGPNPGSGPSPKGKIQLYTYLGNIIRERQLWLKFLTSMEQQASAMGVRIDPHATWDFGVRRHTRFFTGVVPETRAIVCLVRQLSDIANPENKVFQGEIRKALQTGLPVMIFGLGAFPNVSCNSIFGPSHNLYLFHVDDMEAGEEAASFALSLGHRSMAYFSFSQERWNADRFRGLARRIRQVLGAEGRAAHFDANVDKGEMLSDRERKAELSEGFLKRPVKRMLKGFEFSHSAYYNRIAQRIYELATEDDHWPHLVPQFNEALKNPDITLWVCADSSVAEVASNVLRKNNLDYPKDFHLMALDDRPEMTRQGITSQSFNWDRMGYLAAHAALGDIPIRRKRNRVVVCPHAVIDRGSVGRI